MKKSLKIAAVAIAAMFLGNAVNAQSGLQDSEVITVNAKILKQIVLTSSLVQFGSVAENTVPQLDPVDFTNSGLSSPGVTLGRLLVNATSGEFLSLTFPTKITLTNTNASITTNNVIGYVPQMSVKHGDVAVSTVNTTTPALLLGSNNTFAVSTAATSTTTTLNGMGNGTSIAGYISTENNPTGSDEFASVFIGGWLCDDAATVTAGTAPTAVIPSGTATGSYAGTFTVTVDYFF